MTKCVVVVGGIGTIGRSLCAEFGRRGYRVAAFGRDAVRTNDAAWLALHVCLEDEHQEDDSYD